MSIRDDEFFYYIDLEFVFIHKITVQANTIIAEVSDLGVMADHPRYPNLGKLERCNLVFEGVVRSVRDLAEYLEKDPCTGGFGQQYSIDDGPFPLPTGDEKLYIIGGVLTDPCSWLDWEIEARSYQIEVLEPVRL